MTYQLINRNIEGSCERKLGIDDNEHNCSGFVRAVADDLMLFVPAVSGNSDSQIRFHDDDRGYSKAFLGIGRSAEFDSVTYASRGSFVICGMTSSELQKNRKKTVKNGHVAIVVSGWSNAGWPLAWWGQKNGTPRQAVELE
jgi:hypothetical protein